LANQWANDPYRRLRTLATTPTLVYYYSHDLDFFSLLLQAIGGGLASAAFSQNTDPRPGTCTMVAGIIWQLASTCVFATLMEIVIFRAAREICVNGPLVVLCSVTMLSDNLHGNPGRVSERRTTPGLAGISVYYRAVYYRSRWRDDAYCVGRLQCLECGILAS
jgi:hypothetical protein